VIRLLELGADINAVDDGGDSSGLSTIQRVAQMHNFEMLKVLLDAVDRSRSSNKGSEKALATGKLLGCILDAKSFGTLERILYTGADIDTRLRQTIALALRYEQDIDDVNGLGETALFFSIATGNAQYVKELLNTKCRTQLNVPCGQHMLQPLQLAVSLSQEENVKTLLTAGADMNSTYGKLKETCFHLCSRKSGSVEIAGLLTKHFNGSSDEKTRLLNNTRQDGRSPYHLAVYQGHFNLADWYAARGADVEQTLYIVTWNHEGTLHTKST
jgi:hypothetical protein